MINERLAELGGAILKIDGDNFHVTGFMYPERLEDYYIKILIAFILMEYILYLK